MTSSSCYTMQTSPATGPFTLSTFSITQIPTSIYEASTITFNNDINAYKTVDVIQTALTKIDSWCPRSTPTYSALSSSQTTRGIFAVTYNTGVHFIPITQFSATSSCGNPVWKYNGFDAANSQ